MPSIRQINGRLELKLPPQVVFAEKAPSAGDHMRFRLGPQVVIALGARTKRPEEGMMGEPVELVVSEQGEPRSGGRMKVAVAVGGWNTPR